MLQVYLKEEEFEQWFSICEALQHRVHEASVAKILQSSQTPSESVSLFEEL